MGLVCKTDCGNVKYLVRVRMERFITLRSMQVHAIFLLQLGALQDHYSTAGREVNSGICLRINKPELLPVLASIHARPCTCSAVSVQRVALQLSSWGCGMQRHYTDIEQCDIIRGANFSQESARLDLSTSGQEFCICLVALQLPSPVPLAMFTSSNSKWRLCHFFPFSPPEAFAAAFAACLACRASASLHITSTTPCQNLHDKFSGTPLQCTLLFACHQDLPTWKFQERHSMHEPCEALQFDHHALLISNTSIPYLSLRCAAVSPSLSFKVPEPALRLAARALSISRWFPRVISATHRFLLN